MKNTFKIVLKLIPPTDNGQFEKYFAILASMNLLSRDMMTPFQQMNHKVTSSVYHNKMMRNAKLLEDYLGVNHFWYYRITYSGHYSFVGTHTDWNEFSFAHDVFGKSPYSRHPDSLSPGISLMKNIPYDPHLELMNSAAEAFGINFHIHLLKKIPEGIEGYGFGTHSKLQIRDEHLLNELPLLKQFIKQFHEENNKIFKIIYDNQVDLASHIGSAFYENAMQSSMQKNRDDFLRKIGFERLLSLSHQEKRVLKELASGFPAQHIAKGLFLSKRTIEHYIENIRNKLSIDSRVELIEKAKEFAAIDQPFLDI